MPARARSARPVFWVEPRRRGDRWWGMSELDVTETLLADANERLRARPDLWGAFRMYYRRRRLTYGN
jgi:hypothetical protein